jgi:hypothetical protein
MINSSTSQHPKFLVRNFKSCVLKQLLSPHASKEIWYGTLLDFFREALMRLKQLKYFRALEVSVGLTLFLPLTFISIKLLHINLFQKMN